MKFISVLCIMIFMNISPLFAKNATEEFIIYLDEQIPSMMQEYGIPGANIALIKKGEIIWSKAYGYADIGKRRIMTVDTQCRVESISKSITAWGVMKLVEQGRIDLDKPVRHYLRTWDFPESRFPTDRITARLLLSGCSGMPLGTIGVRYSPHEPRPSLRESLSRDAVLQRKPGQSFAYSNTGFNILELLIEEVTGRDFADYMKNDVLIPLGMHHSDFNWNSQWDPPVPHGHDGAGKPIPVYVYPDKAAGGLFATVNDIAYFVTAGMSAFSRRGEAVLHAKTIESMYEPAVELSGFFSLAFDYYGFGHFIEILPDGRKALSHGGQGSGWMTHFHFVPETGDGIVILTNSQRSWPFFSAVLSDWSRSSGFDSIGMGMIIKGTRLLWGIIGLLSLAVFWQALLLGRDITRRRRRFEPFSGSSRLIRSLRGTLGFIFAALLLWAVNQDYLFLTSVFPSASPWLGLAMMLCSIVLLLSALFSPVEEGAGSAKAS